MNGPRWGRVLQVQTTFDRREDADRIGGNLVRARLAACAQVVGPIRSTYRWRAGVETADEWLCLLKTTAERYPGLESALREAHPYEEPEIVAVAIVEGSIGYLAWVRDSVAEDDSGSPGGTDVSVDDGGGA